MMYTATFLVLFLALLYITTGRAMSLRVTEQLKSELKSSTETVTTMIKNIQCGSRTKNCIRRNDKISYIYK